MQLYFFISLTIFFTYGYSKTDVPLGYQLTLEVPFEYSVGFIGRAFLMENNETKPSFKVAMSVEDVVGKYSCSLQVFLGDVKVWSSGHYSKFYTSNICVLELSHDGDLRLKGPKDRVGWRSGTSGQGVQRLQMLRTGNLVLVDALGNIKWQSFNFPTDVMLSGQRLSVASRLTSFPSNPTSYFSLEIEPSRIALYLNSGKWNYSYWEFKPTKNRNIAYIQLGPKGLELFSYNQKKIAQIHPSDENFQFQPMRFLALENQTGNLRLYFYSPSMSKFDASFQALNTTCDLPLACKPYGVCTLSGTCSCIQLLMTKNETSTSTSTTASDCGRGISSRGFCKSRKKMKAEMLELKGVSSVLRGATKSFNVSKEACGDLCLEDCNCTAALYSSAKGCFVYGMVIGVKQVENKGSGLLSYMVKVPKGGHGGHGKSNLKKWVLILVGVVDGLIILLVFGGLGFYLVSKRRRRSLSNGIATDSI
ncbi:G-type lectin S-receptor-like serine/threonine-protein kinase SD2-5 [Pyrus x bretschneideri]|uniref:G-type lectin S-receptor-like serine/threonine-protein kinase SD2-5 n=1 Tax=Pyrus x bretschneideri TaxID=225117 RepID=UPI0005117429|nr:G-type lectin S-receptor-like serine/threonine-protein kinase SD2-5 [Pyrus x bretschneideri]